MRCLAAILLAGMSLGACTDSPSPSASNAPPPAREPGSGARITGQIVVDGVVPPAGRIRFDADPQCMSLTKGEEQHAEDVIVGESNALQNVFVYVKEGLPTQAYAVSSEPVVLDQQRCRYIPRVLGLQVGQQLTIRNSDPLLHTVRGEAAVNDRFNIGTPLQGIEVTRVFDAREVMLPVTCDMHPWMRAYVGVLEHPFFDVTDSAGRFEISGLPAGTYVVEIWHERLGTQRQEVSVSTRDITNVSFTYNAS